jgi:hypothetical protein
VQEQIAMKRAQKSGKRPPDKDDVVLHGEDEVADGGAQGKKKKPSASRQFAELDGTSDPKRRSGRGGAVQTLLNFVGTPEAAGTPKTPAAAAPMGRGAEFVPAKLRGTALDFVNRESEKDAALEEEARKRQAMGSSSKKRVLDPEGLPGTAWVAFRAAKEGENVNYVYCKAHGYKSQYKCNDGRGMVKISKDAKGLKLKYSNAESHLELCHPEWWAAMLDAAKHGKNVKKTFDDLVKADTPLPRQRNIHVVKTTRPGQLHKELAYLVWIVRNKISFNALSDPIGFGAVCATTDIQLRSTDSIKNLTFALHEVAIRDTVARIRQAGAYSITLDYWTASNGNKFLAITYHWTDDDWNVCSQTLDLVPIEGTASGLVTKTMVDMRTDDHFGERSLWGEAVRP